jgi:hypothetical protein
MGTIIFLFVAVGKITSDHEMQLILIFTTVVLYKVAVNTEWCNLQLFLLVEYGAGVLQTSSHIFVTESVHNLVLCVFLGEDTLFNIIIYQFNII